MRRVCGWLNYCGTASILALSSATQVLAQAATAPRATGGRQQGLSGQNLEQQLGLDFATSDLPTIIVNILNAILFIAGVFVLAYLIYGGFLYVTAGGDEEKAGGGRKAITNAIIGVIIIVAAIALLQFVRSRI